MPRRFFPFSNEPARAVGSQWAASPHSLQLDPPTFRGLGVTAADVPSDTTALCTKSATLDPFSLCPVFSVSPEHFASPTRPTTRIDGGVGNGLIHLVSLLKIVPPASLVHLSQPPSLTILHPRPHPRNPLLPPSAANHAYACHLAKKILTCDTRAF